MFDDIPIFITRLVVDVGGIMNGGAAHVGSVGVTASTRSCTSCRACRMSVPGLKELDRRQLRHRLGADDVEPRDAVERLLEGDGDQLFHFVRGQPEAERLDLDARRRKLGKGVHRHGA